MERKKQIKVFNSFQELEADELKRGINMSLQEHFETFFKMREFHNLFFSEEKIDKTIKDRFKKTYHNFEAGVDLEDNEF